MSKRLYTDAPSAKSGGKDGSFLSVGRISVLLSVLCAVCVSAMIYALVTTGQKMPEFVPPPFDTTAETGTPDVPENLGWSEIDAKEYKFSVCGVIAPKNENADLWMTNPAGNKVWLKARILDKDGNILGETGLIRPGEYVRSVRLNASLKDGDPIIIKIMSYEPDTYYSAGTVGLNITVKGDVS